MLSIMLAALVHTTSLPAPTMTPVHAGPRAPGMPAVTRRPFGKGARIVTAFDEEHLLKARAAMHSGALDVARREFIVAAALDRADGKLPREATFGLAHVLFGQQREAEAAQVLDELATEALIVGETDCAALALQDALWLHVRGNRRAAAHRDGMLLKELLDGTRLSPAVRREVESRFR